MSDFATLSLTALCVCVCVCGICLKNLGSWVLHTLEWRAGSTTKVLCLGVVRHQAKFSNSATMVGV